MLFCWQINIMGGPCDMVALAGGSSASTGLPRFFLYLKSEWAMGYNCYQTNNKTIPFLYFSHYWYNDISGLH